MREYGKVHVSFWSSADMRRLSEDGRILALYLLTSHHGTIAGVFRLPNGYACEDLQWTIERLGKGFAELLESGFATRCERTNWVWVRKHLRWNPPENPNQRKAAAKVFAQVPDECGFRVELARVLASIVGADVLGFHPDELTECETVPQPLPNQKQEQEQEQKQEQEEQCAVADAPTPVSVVSEATPPDSLTTESKPAKAPAKRKKSETSEGDKPFTVGDLVALGIDPQSASDWMKNRKLKKLAATHSALRLVELEAAKLGWTVKQAIERAAGEGWGGFKASWITGQQTGGQQHGRTAQPQPQQARSAIERFVQTNYPAIESERS